MTERTFIRVDDDAADDLLSDLLEVEVSEDVAQASVFRLRLASTVTDSGAWRHVDDERLQVWHRLSLGIGFGGTPAQVLDGYITHVDATFQASGSGFVEVSGMDRSAALQVEHKQRPWPGRTDDQIARSIFTAAGLDPDTTPTDVPASETVATTLQNDTDMQLLRRLAERNGFECYVRGGTGYFGPPRTGGPLQSVLAVAFGGETNVGSAHLAVDGTRPVSVTAKRLDPHSGAVETETREASPHPRLGRRALAELCPAGLRPSGVLRQEASTSRPGLSARVRAAYRTADDFVRLTGEVDGRLYTAVLRAGRPVTVKGLGPLHSGVYYVSRVNHQVSSEAYTQRFEAWRNGVGLLGAEVFDRQDDRADVARGTV